MNPKIEPLKVGDRVRKSGQYGGVKGTVVELVERKHGVTAIAVRLDSGTMKYRSIAYWEKA